MRTVTRHTARARWRTEIPRRSLLQRAPRIGAARSSVSRLGQRVTTSSKFVETG